MGLQGLWKGRYHTLNDELNKKDILIDETNDILERFDAISGKLEKPDLHTESTDAPAEEPTSTTERIAARRAARHQKKEKSFLEKASDTLAASAAAVIVACKNLGKGKKKADPIAETGDPMRADEKKRTASAKKTKAEAAGAEQESKKKSKKKKKKKKGRTLKIILLVILILGLICCAVVGAWIYKIVKNTPSINPDNIYDMLSENSIIYDDKGEPLEYLYDKDVGLRTNLNYNDIPQNLVNAFVAIEDYTFWEHNGFNFIRIIGAIRDSLVTGDPISGTSTITQQLARNLYLEETKNVRSYERKIQEAYYTIILERELSKEQIIEAYLNTIYLGANSYGISAAAESYFSKEVSDLTLAECALLASIPKSPTKYSPIATYNSDANVDFSSMDVVYRDASYTTVYKDDFMDRLKLVLRFMEEQGKITAEQKEQALAEDLRASINPSRETTTTISSYFADYVTSEVIADLMEEYDLTREEARKMLNTGGLRIYSTIDTAMQKKAETAFAQASNFPTVTNLNADADGNARDKNNNILLYKYNNLFDKDGNFTFTKDEFQKNSDGSVTIFRGNRVNVYRTESNGNVDVQLEFKYLYTIEDGIFYQINGGVVNIPAKYKTRDDKGNLVINAQFFQDQDWFQIKDGKITFGSDHYTLRQKTIQPQGAMVIFDYHTGGIKAMIGGRSTTGKLLYNRSLSTRQPGSSIKPLAVYSAALQRSLDLLQMEDERGNKKTAAELRQEGTTIWTAASVVDDSPTLNELGELWPKNWYNTYRGLHTLRKSVEQSVNVNAVKVQQDIGNDTSIAMLKALGVTSVNESEGSVNDKNPSALALGGMVNGISPLEMAAAYGTFANKGVYTEPIAYTKVTNKMGDVLLDNTPETRQAMDEGVAFLMTDMLRTTVSQGICGAANFSGQIVAGKTGTTTDNFDAWFVGMTPYYSAALWIGNDVGLELSTGSTAASKLWSKIMKECHTGLEKASYPEAPENVIRVTVDSQSGMLPGEYTASDLRGNTSISEYFLKGTEPLEEAQETDTSHVMVTICTETGYLATPQCTHTETVLRVQHPEDSMLMYCGYKLPDNFCLPLDYTYEADEETWEKWKSNPKAVQTFKYPDDLAEVTNIDIKDSTRFTTVKYNFPVNVLEDILEKYGSLVTYTVGDLDYAAPVYYCYSHNNHAAADDVTPIDPYVLISENYVVPEYVRAQADPEYEGAGSDAPGWLGGNGTSSDDDNNSNGGGFWDRLFN